MPISGKPDIDAMLASQELKDLIADFSHTWPEGVTRTRDVVTLVEGREAE